jgi:hypothetical protein
LLGDESVVEPFICFWRQATEQDRSLASSRIQAMGRQSHIQSDDRKAEDCIKQKSDAAQLIFSPLDSIPGNSQPDEQFAKIAGTALCHSTQIDHLKAPVSSSLLGRLEHVVFAGIGILNGDNF